MTRDNSPIRVGQIWQAPGNDGRPGFRRVQVLALNVEGDLLLKDLHARIRMTERGGPFKCPEINLRMVFTLEHDVPDEPQCAHVEFMGVETDEDGWHLLIQDDDGARYDFAFHGVAFEFAGSKGLRSLLDWWQEGEAMRLAHQLDSTAAGGDFETGYASDHGADESGYDLNDPKHPRYRELFAGRADLARKREKGE